MEANDPLLIAELRRDEGVRYSPYKDTVGIDTVGVGHNLKAKPLPSDTEYPLTDEQVDKILADDIAEVNQALNKAIPWWQSLTQARQRVLANMCFNLGIAGLMSFHNTLTAIKCGHYELASVNMLSSKWSQQTGARAKRLAKMMVLG